MSQSALAAVAAYLNPPTSGRKKYIFGMYRIEGATLKHRDNAGDPTLIAFKLPDGTPIGNAGILPNVGKRMAWGREVRNRNQTEVQRRLEDAGVAMLPFQVFQAAGLDVTKLRIVERASAEQIIRSVPTGRWKKHEREMEDRRVHFVGASVFAVPDSEGTEKFYLFDVDRREVEHKIFNPFLVQLPHAVASVAEAYIALKPKQVAAAESKGLDVKRQGEWFFIPAKAPKLPSRKLTADAAILLLAARVADYEVERITRETGIQFPKSIKAKMKKGEQLLAQTPRQGQLRAGQNRPNTVETYVVVDGVNYVRGRVSHTGREHADLILETWHVAVPNTATTSWQITGDID